MKLKFDDHDGSRLLCPTCDFAATHVDVVRVAARAEDREFNEIFVDGVTGRVATHEDSSAPVGPRMGTGRRHRIAVTGHCESGHGFAIVFTQHKGETFVEVVATNDVP
ncbi:hypothetical protein [Amycolatopsis sp. NPDC102389]|uniref:hypothetical protein n=1 Tax=Amycolatopsis sp. NPDC102389 TaxID=3363941 RepID=UPI00380437D1